MTRLPPQNLDAEMATLGSMMMNAGVVDDVVAVLGDGAAFSVPQHRTIYAALVAIHARSEPMDLLVAVEELRRAGKLEEVGGHVYLITLAESFGEAANAPHYARLVALAWQARRCVAVADRLRERASSEALADPNELCADAQAELETILHRPASDALVVVKDFIPRLQAMWQARRSTTIGIGYSEFDALTGGLERPGMVVVGARPSAGKTAFALAVCLQATRQGVPCLFVSLETTAKKLCERVVAMLTGDSVRRIVKLETPEGQTHKLRFAADRMSGAPFYVVDQTHTRDLRMIVSTCRALCRRHGIGLIAVDYLQLVEPGGKIENRTLEVTRVSAAMKALAIQTGTTVLALSQLNRGAEGMRPSLASLRESGALEQDADMVILLHRDEMVEKDAEEERKVLFMLAKNKDGPTFEKPVFFHKATMLFWPEIKTSEETRRADHAIGMGDDEIPF